MLSLVYPLLVAEQNLLSRLRDGPCRTHWLQSTRQMINIQVPSSKMFLPNFIWCSRLIKNVSGFMTITTNTISFVIRSTFLYNARTSQVWMCCRKLKSIFINPSKPTICPLKILTTQQPGKLSRGAQWVAYKRKLLQHLLLLMLVGNWPAFPGLPWLLIKPGSTQFYKVTIIL